MSPQIQVPEPANDLPDLSQNTRHLRRLSFLIGIPLLIVAIVIGVYFYSLTSDKTASKNTEPSISSNLGKNALEIPNSTAGILPDQNQDKLPNGNNSVANYTSRFEAINKSLSDYDQIFSDLKVSGSCYSSSQEKVAKQDIWAIGLNILLDESIPEISSAPTQDKIAELKQLNKEYTQNIKDFIEGQNKISAAWLGTKKAVFKICDGPIDQIEASCKDATGVIDNYKKLLIPENNKELFAGLDSVIDYCTQAPNLVKTDNEVKFNEINNSFQAAFAKIVSIYPNIGDKTQTIKANQAKIRTVLEELSK